MRVAPQQPWQRTLVVVVMVQVLMACAFSISGPFIPLYVMSLGVHPIAAVDWWSGAIMSANFLFAALLSPVWGGLADRVGRKAMVVRSCTAIAVFTLLMGFAHNVWQLFAARAAMGIFSGFSAAAIALVGTLVPEEELGFSLGWVATGQLVGGLFGPLIGGVLVDRVHDYRWVFFFTAAFAVAAGLTCLLFVRESFEAHPEVKAQPSLGARLREVATHPELVPMFLVVLLAQIVAFGSAPVVPLFVHSLVGDVPWLGTAAGASFAVMGLADLIASPFLGKRSDKLGYRRVLLFSLAGVAVFTLPQAFAGGIAAFIALRFGVGAFLGGVLPTANAMIGRMFAAHKRGGAYGVSSSATFLGMFAGPLIGGGIAAHFGFSAVFLTLGALAAINLGWVAWKTR